MTWGAQRKTYIILGLIVFFSIPVFTWLFLLLYEAPNCSDGLQNGQENGIDCGGSCDLICTQDVEPLSTVWYRTFPESQTAVTGIALIENKNNAAEARSVPMTFALFSEGLEIDSKTQLVTLVPQKRTPVIIKGLEFGASQIDFTSFAVGQPDGWYKKTVEEKLIRISNERIDNSQGRVKIFAIVSNESFTEQYIDIDFAVIAYNVEGNVIGYSTTYLESFAPQSREEIFLTWTQALEEKISRIEIIPLI